MFFDIHTHIRKQEPDENTFSIFNTSLSDFDSTVQFSHSFNYSLGLHPWKIEENTLSKNLSFIKEKLQQKSLKAIGETGLDKMCDTSWDLQQRAFVAQIELSEEAKKPLIIHSVKAFDEIIALKKEIQPQQNWIIHGFRGKPQQMEQLIQQGFYLSFGLFFNEETIRLIPKDRLFLETDEANISIQDIYQKVSESTNITVENLLIQIEKNFKNCF